MDVTGMDVSAIRTFIFWIRHECNALAEGGCIDDLLCINAANIITKSTTEVSIITAGTTPTTDPSHSDSSGVWPQIHRNILPVDT